jgi:acyl-CoA reductase-like NAD-dependent aldehyde dehydrogenase
MPEYHMLIRGELVPGYGEIDVINPATEEVVGVSPIASEAQLNEAVEAAASAFPKWSQTPIKERREALLKVAQIVDDNTQELGWLLTSEQGKPLSQAISETKGLAFFIRQFADMTLPVETLEDSSTRYVEVHRFPLGVVAAIIPWNVPLLLLGIKLGPALLAGNTLIVKPAPTTPLSTLKLAELIHKVFPAGVLNVITDANHLGDKITSHPKIHKISFTGSTATGVKVMSSAATTLKRLTLELGGNDAAIVLDDVDIKNVAPKIFRAAFNNCGQVCIAIKRLYVHESIYDALCQELTSVANSQVIGNGAEKDTDLGPLQNHAQFEKVKDLLSEASQDGRIIAGGKVMDRKGYFIEPTLVCDIDETSRLVTEEQFGPILPILKFSDPLTAIEGINESPQGLGGSIWSGNLKKARELALLMDTGTVWINKHPDVDPKIPIGGAKASGLGVELGQEGLDEFVQKRVINELR